MNKGLKIFFIILITGLIVMIVLIKQKKNNINNYETIHAEIKTVINKRFISGTIIPSKEINLMPQLSGIIEKIYVNTGDKVDVGTKIAKIKLIASPDIVERANKIYSAAKLSYMLNKKEYERNKILFNKEYISASEYEKSENNFLLSKEELESAKKQLQISKKGYSQGSNISNIVTSTVKGTVLELPLKTGASVIEKNNFGKGSVIAVIADMNRLIFKGKVNENDLLFLHKDMIFNVSIAALSNKKFKTVLTNISLKGKNENEIVKFDFEGKLLPDKSDSLPTRSGYSGIAEIVLEKAENVLTVEEKDIFFRNDSAFVELITDEGIIEKNIILGVSDGLIVEVKKGINKNSNIKVQN